MHRRHAAVAAIAVLLLAGCASAGPATGPSPADRLKEQSAELAVAAADHVNISLANLAALQRREIGNEEAKAIAETVLRLSGLIEGARLAMNAQERDVNSLALAAGVTTAMGAVKFEADRLRTLARAAGIWGGAP